MANTGNDAAFFSGTAGEYLVAGQLLKCRIFAATLGHAKAIDLLAYNQKTNTDFSIQVKTRTEMPRTSNRGDPYGWIMRSVEPSHVYVFVVLHGPNEPEEYFVVKGQTLVADYARFSGPEFDPNKPGPFDGVGRESVEAFRNNWQVFDECTPPSGA